MSDRSAANAATNAGYGRIFIGQSTGAAEFDRSRQIITNFATRAFRRPLKTDEQQRLMALFESARAGGADFNDCLKLVLEAVLVSPHFLFRGEFQSQGYRLASNTARGYSKYFESWSVLHFRQYQAA